MRKFGSFAFSAAAALALSMTTSCQKELEQAPVPSSETSTVCFTLSEPDTKTAMGTIGDKVTNVWSSDDNTRMTFYQNGTASESVTITSDDDYKHASFTATFAEATADSYTYKALLAKNTVNGLPVVPAVQHPTASSFDPDANVLVGLETEFASKPEKVDLVYKHAAAISRISFTGIPTGLTIYGVQINASSAIAGAAKSVDYSDGIVDYSDASENTISLIYDSAPSYSEGKFDAYFVTIPGSSVKITDIKLVTDKGTFVKTNSGSSTTTFDVSKFKTVKVAVPSTRTFYKATGVEAGQNYVIVSNESYGLKRNNSTLEYQRFSVVNDMVTCSEDPSAYLWTASAEKDFTLHNGGYYICSDASLSQSNTPAKFNYSKTELSSGTNNFYYSTYNTKWRFGSSSYGTIIFTSKLPQALAYSLSEASYDIAKKAFVGSAPVLTGASGSVTYTSSAPSVATVDAAGNVTVISTKDGDKATITATVEGNALYQSSSASYTLTVMDSSKKYYRKVSIKKLSDLTSGQYLLYSASNKYLFDATQSTKYRTSQDAPTNDKIAQSTDLDKLLVTFEEASSGKYYVKTSTSKGYLGRSSSSIEFNTSPSKEFTIILSSEGQISLSTTGSGSTYYLRYDSGFSYSTKSSSVVQFDLYLLDGSKKTSRNLEFAAPSVSKNLGADAFINTLNGYADGVTFTSTNTNVATVDSKTGQVTVSSSNAGTTTITASAPETETYRAGSATFTLTVIDPTSITSYKKVSSVTSGKTYLVVDKNNGFALMYSENNSKDNKMEVAPEDGIITAASANTYVNCEFVITADGGNYTFYSEKNKKYLGWYNGSSTYMGFFDSGSTGNPITFTLPKGNEATQEGYLFFKSTKSGSKSGGSYNEWLYYNSSSTCFKIGGSGNPDSDDKTKTDQGVILYEKQ